VIVLDEPTAGVDVELRQTLWHFVRRLNRDGHTIVLTTHYLDEAQDFCERIAMLKHGKLVALDETRALLRRFAAGRLVLRLSGAPLPPLLEPLVVESPDTERITLRVERYDAVEAMLVALREAGCRIDEMELLHPDLEDVFVSIMKEPQP
jgi:ABC-2 type transport system ATP-binding protein